MELGGEKVPNGIDGRSLCGLIDGRATSVRPYAITAGWEIHKSRTVTVQDEGWSLVAGLPDSKEKRAQWEQQPDLPLVMELYNTKEDPAQKKNLLKQKPQQAQKMLKYLSSFMREHGGGQEFVLDK